MQHESNSDRPTEKGNGLRLGTTGLGLIVLTAIALVALFVLAVFLLSGSPSEQVRREVEQVDDSWQRILAAGKIVVGTSADYPPFAYYIGKKWIDGFDVAVMDEIGRRLGVQVDYRAYAFNDLGDALEKRQIDAAIAAISASPARAATVDFSDSYFVTHGAVVAYFVTSAAIDQVEDLAGHRIGVQSGSVYEALLRSELVDTGLTPAGNLLAYPEIEGAIADLTGGHIDFVVMDLPAARQLDLQVGLAIAGEGLYPQSFSLALPKGSNSLLGEINRAIDELEQEGTIARLASQYLDPQAGQHAATIVPDSGALSVPLPPAATPRPGASSTPTPSITPAPSATPTSTGTPTPSTTPVPTATPQQPIIISFSVSPYQISAGQCVTIAWSVGGGTSYSRILRNSQIIIDNAGVSGQQIDCLDQAGSYTYRLEASNPAGDTAFREQPANVISGTP
jgi:polar amino acid transport system substrate-binding protein